MKGLGWFCGGLNGCGGYCVWVNYGSDADFSKEGFSYNGGAEVGVCG